jgi:hypothetical protein
MRALRRFVDRVRAIEAWCMAAANAMRSSVHAGRAQELAHSSRSGQAIAMVSGRAVTHGGSLSPARCPDHWPAASGKEQSK